MEQGKELAVKDDSLPFRMMDALDDQLIIAELEGRMPEILTYHFSDRGQEVWGLSKAGVDEATGELSKQGEVIRELELNFTDGEKEAYFTVKAGRYVIAKSGQEVLLDTKFGTKRQPKKTTKKDGSQVDNSFWYEQGSIKACRNASMRLIPKTIVQAVIENAKKVGKVKEVKQEDIDAEMEVFKKESEKLFVHFHDALISNTTISGLQLSWKELNTHKKELLPEHFADLERVKNEKKEKLAEVK